LKGHRHYSDAAALARAVEIVAIARSPLVTQEIRRQMRPGGPLKA
jgi:hypothetical protein